MPVSLRSSLAHVTPRFNAALCIGRHMTFKINPNKGIGPVKLGMSREEVKEALGIDNCSSSNRELDYYFNNSFQIEFEENRANFIGVSYHPSYIITYEGVNVFDTEAKKLFELIASNESEKHEFNSSGYLFSNQIVTLWDADEQYDRIGSETRLIWAQIGIGTQSYLQAVS